MESKNIVCLGGGIGTVNLIKGLRQYPYNITIVVSMADDGGSAGRLRRFYQIEPPGDVVSCAAALCFSENPQLSELLTYRFPGDRYGKDDELAGHKLGNLIITALRDITGDFYLALELYKKLFELKGTILPATQGMVSLQARTVEGKIIEGEENIDLGNYEGKKVLEQINLAPVDPIAGKGVIEAILSADVIIAGPGDLYTNILPVLVVPGIAQAIEQSPAAKLFIVNVANKPFETKGYMVSDFINAIVKHIGSYPFDKTIVNNNISFPIPKEYDYQFVPIDRKAKEKNVLVIEDLVDQTFPLYHDSQKLARTVVKAL